MKFLKSIGMVALTGVLFVSCKKNTEECEKIIPQNKTESPIVKKEIAPENLQAATFKIEGMTCAIGCAKTIQENLSSVDGVQTAEVDFDKKLATVTFDKTIQNQASLTQIVQATGDGTTYKVSDFK
ncbi:heavy-metal-associated domain-containing protein [Flavobacterium sp.]|uniref:heavy-metal-associated domain-containing protein n=1 Tax=Flavobacterium sp. TaxID=239 RepID=UPI003C6A66DD